MNYLHLTAITLLAASCGPETTSFRTTDKGDATDPARPSRAAYDVQVTGPLVAHVHVWSNGGYLGTSGDPMTHIGFEVENASGRPITFDSDALTLLVFDNTGELLPATLTAVTPLGPSQVAIAPRATVTLDSYFKLTVRPRVVDHMNVRWSLRIDDGHYDQTTSFTRDDDYPVLDYHRNGSDTREVPRT